MRYFCTSLCWVCAVNIREQNEMSGVHCADFPFIQNSTSFIHIYYRLVSILTLCMKCNITTIVQIIVFLP